MRIPICPRCKRQMKQIKARDHLFWRCLNAHRFHSELFGILGQISNFKTRRLIDPVTLEIVDNPNFRNSLTKA